jgi:hypothetical protein
VLQNKRISLFGILIDLLIDAALIGMGLVLYYQFMVMEIFPVTLSPALTSLVGGFNNAVYLISGLPFVVGVLSLLRTTGKVFKAVAAR